jgi:hypothetical protein
MQNKLMKNKTSSTEMQLSFCKCSSLNIKWKWNEDHYDYECKHCDITMRWEGKSRDRLYECFGGIF